MAKKSNKNNRLFTPIDDLKSAKESGRLGVIACALIILGTAVMTFISPSISGTTTQVLQKEAIVGIAIYSGLAVMIYRMSRVAAIAALVLYCLERILIMAMQLQPINLGGMSNVIIVSIVMAFISSIRGTFAYHRLRKQQQKDLQAKNSPETYIKF